MNNIPVPTLIKSIVELLTEAYAGPPDPPRTWFIDNEPDAGILGLISKVSAAEASRSLDGSGGPGTTIASHVEHLRWSVANMNAVLRGEQYGSWSESWQKPASDPAGWDQLRGDLRTEFETLRDGLKDQTELQVEYLSGLIALVSHAAYHLGTIRHMISMVRASA